MGRRGWKKKEKDKMWMVWKKKIKIKIKIYVSFFLTVIGVMVGCIDVIKFEIQDYYTNYMKLRLILFDCLSIGLLLENFFIF